MMMSETCTQPFPDDEALVRQFQGGEHTAFDTLLGRYDPWIRRLIARYFLVGGDRDDLLQIGRIALWQAALHYQESKGLPFREWTRVIIRRHMTDVIKHSARHSTSVLDHALSLDAPARSHAGPVVSLGETLQDPASWTSLCLDPATPSSELLACLAVQLTEFEWLVLTDLLLRRSLEDSARHLHCNAKAIDNARSRIRRKARKSGT